MTCRLIDKERSMKGMCLCKKVTIEVDETHEFDACHCTKCRRWTGGPFLAIHGGKNVTIVGEAFIAKYQSSEIAQRGFCRSCGTHLFYYLVAANEYFLSIGLFQNKSDFVFKSQIFIDSKPNYYQFADVTQELTEQQVFESFGLSI